MLSFGNAASSHSGLIPLKNVYKKRGEIALSKLQNMYYEVNFCGENIYGDFYLRELIRVDRWEDGKIVVPNGIFFRSLLLHCSLQVN